MRFRQTAFAFFLFVCALAACRTEGPEAPADTSDTDAPPAVVDDPTDPSAAPDEPAAQCRLTTSWDGPVTTTCSAAAAACIDKAKAGSKVSSCITTESSCASCYDEVMRGCLVGTPGKPGVCAEKAGCVEGCLTSACGDKPTNACLKKARAGACKEASDALQTCLDGADQTACLKRFRDECLPKATCGNGKVESGETCDGNCPASCPEPPAGDLCTLHTLKGNAATCSARCEEQSTCPAKCPANTAPLSTVGTIASGTTLPAAPTAAWPSLASMKTKGCPSSLLTDSNVIAWRAPAAGRYTFTGTCDITWTSTELGTGKKLFSSLDCARRVAVARGRQCSAGVEPFACALDLDNSHQQSLYPDKKTLAPLDLAAGDEILLAAAFGPRTNLPPEKTSYSYDGHISAISWSVSATSCTPSCSGKTCGSDGCGGSCGSCAAGEICSATGACQPSCVPSCGGKTCGSNGCGGSCGSCTGGETCSGGMCKPVCIPSCSGKSCGSDGCGGSCGSCSAAQYCNAGTCKLSGECDPVANVGCTSPNQCITLANETNQCVLMGSGTQGSSCSDSSQCRGGHGCFAGTCRKICERFTNAGCTAGKTCAAVSGWLEFGTCH